MAEPGRRLLAQISRPVLAGAAPVARQDEAARRSALEKSGRSAEAEPLKRWLEPAAKGSAS
jgi:hypothetical protein